MKSVITIGSDRSILENNSRMRERMCSQSKHFETHDIVIFSKHAHNITNEQETKQFDNVNLYPTHSISRLFYIFDAYKIVSNLVKLRVKEQRDIVISCQDPFEAGLVGLLIKRRFGQHNNNISLQIQVHTDLFSPYFIRQSLLNKVRVFIAQFVLPRATCLRVVSRRIERSINNKYKNFKIPITVLPVFSEPLPKYIDERETNAILATAGDYDRIILMVARFEPEKNVELAIRAMPYIRKAIPDALLMIVGSGSQQHKLEELVKRLGLSTSVKMLPWTKNVAPYYKVADILLVTSNYEGYCLSAVEAITSGLPVVMTNVGVAGELIFEGINGAIFPVNNHTALLEAVLRILSSSDGYNEVKKRMANSQLTLPGKEEYFKTYAESIANCGQT